MSKTELIKRYLLLLLGLTFISFGVAIVTKASLGTSPISAIPYSLSMIIPVLSMGNWTIIFSILLVFLQVLLLKGNVKKSEVIIEIIISFAFGYLIDFGLFCFSWFNPEIYVIKIIALIIGCMILAFGVYFQVIADVSMVPGDAFVRALTKVTKKEFGTVRVCSDASMVVIAAILCLVFLHELSGVREGSIISALIVGNFVKIITRIMRPVTEKLVSSPKVPVNTEISASNNFILTISREYGSGGRQIGKIVAENLGIKFHDSDLLHMVALKSGMDESSIEKDEEQIHNPIRHNFYEWYTSALSEEDLPRIEKIFNVEKRVIQEVAAEGPCVIVGRQANLILGPSDNHLHAFISSDKESKIARVMERENLTEAQAAAKLLKVEKERKNHCKHFFKKEWKSCDNYDVSFCASKYGIEETAEMLTEMAKSIIKEMN